MIKRCSRKDIKRIYTIINEAAKVYKGVILDDCYHEPYMPMEELLKEANEMSFYGYYEDKKLFGVMGFQPVKDATLIRHTYILPEFQGKGIGTKMLNFLKKKTKTEKLLVGTWTNARWAIRFYEKNGFRLMENKDELLKKYWNITEKQIRNSVVLGITLDEQ